MASTTTPSSTPADSSPYHHPTRPGRFAPINPSRPNSHGAPPLQGIIFDVDGTLCLPQNYMFKEMRDAFSIPKGVDILEYTRSLSDEPDSLSPTASSSTTTTSPPNSTAQSKVSANSTDPPSASPPSSPRSRALSTILQIERRAMSSRTPQPGLTELISYFSARNIRKALCTRNLPTPVHHLLEKYLPTHTFWPVVTRETEGVKPKPSPQGIWWIARAWRGCDSERGGDMKLDGGGGRGGGGDGDGNDNSNDTSGELQRDEERRLGAGLIMVGDSIDDLAAGHHAGAPTVLLVNKGENEHLRDHELTDLAVERLDELIKVLERGFVGRGGDDGI